MLHYYLLRQQKYNLNIYCEQLKDFPQNAVLDLRGNNITNVYPFGEIDYEAMKANYVIKEQ